MEKRAIVTILICTILFFVWMFVISPLFWPKGTPPAGPQTPPPQNPPERTPAETAGFAQGRKKEDPPRIHPEVKTESRSDTVTFGRFDITYTSRGGGLKGVSVRTNHGPAVPVLGSVIPDVPHFALRVPQSAVALDQVDWKVSVDNQNRRIAFEYTVDNRWIVVKQFTFDENRYVVRLLLQFRLVDPESQPVQITPELLPFLGIQHDGDYRYDEYCQAFVGLRKGNTWSVETISPGDVGYDFTKPKVVKEAKQDWMGVKNRYFAAVLVPEGSRELGIVEEMRFACLPPLVWKALGEKKNITTSVQLKPLSLGRAPEAFEFSLYLGPIRSQELSEIPRGLTELYDPSGFNFIAAGILFILNFGFSLFKNYGIAILFTTLVIRLLLFPLSRKSQVSMYRIQQLGPKLQILRERYKDDRERFGREQMKLFREQKINPMSGCLPMVLQLPIFIGMYGVLDSAFDLRQSPFFLWIGDLSMPDRLVSFGGNVDLLLFSMNALNLLPIVMTITWFLQSYFAPRSDDPQMAAQQKMMMYMPIVFGVMCYNLASGLSFYFFVNSLYSMLETKLIKKLFLPKESGKKA